MLKFVVVCDHVLLFVLTKDCFDRVEKMYN